MRIVLIYLIFSLYLHESYSQAITVNGVGLTSVSGPGGPGSCNGDYKFLNNGIPTPSISGNCVVLTDGTPANGEGDVWVCSALDLTNDFNLTFTANFGTNPNSGDGIAFVLNGNNDASLGGVGGNIGYEALNNAVAVEFDTWPDADINCHHAEINQNGFSNNLSSPIPLKSCCGSIVDGSDYDICITWDVLTGTTGNLTATFDGNVVGTYSGDLAVLLGNNSSPNWGFTSGCGAGGGQIQTVCDVVMENQSLTVSNCSTCTPPAVTGNPLTETICSGETTSLSISGSGGTSYCWQASDNLNVNGETTTITNETSSSFIIGETLINGVPGTQTVIYNVYPESNSGCFGIPLSLTVTVLDAGDPACNCPSPYSVGAPSTTPTVCISTPLVNVTHGTTNSTGIDSDGISGANGLPPGVGASFSGNASNGVVTISGTPTQAGTFNYSIPFTGGCGTATATGTITVIQTPTADSPTDVTACDSYVLPSLGVGDYFSSPGGVGPISVGSTITATQIIYVYAETGTVPNCTDENSFTVTINTAPTADSPTDVTACDSYVLPSLGVGDYFSSTNGVGPISVGSTITATQIIYVYAETGTVPNCTDESSFTVTINSTPTADSPTDVTACDSYVLPSLNVGDYYSSPGGVGPISVGSTITATQTIYVYAETGTVPNCSDENSFTVTINSTQVADSPTDVTACDSYVLPSLNIGNYYSSPGGVGPISVGSTIASTQTIYVYAETGTVPNCTDESSFTVTIEITPSYSLVASDPTFCNGSDGNILISGLLNNTSYDVTYDDGITVVGPSSMISDGAGQITISNLIAGNYDVFLSVGGSLCTGIVMSSSLSNPGAPDINPIADYSACDIGYVLPAITGASLSGSQAYYDAPGGPAGGGALIPIGTNYNSPSNVTLYAYDENGVCSDQEPLTININTTPTADSPIDVTACDSYVLPSLNVGDYYSSPNGVGPISVGSTITATQTIYVYAETGTVPNCTDENSFTVTINSTPVADSPTDATACDSYVLPSLNVGDYFSSPGGVGPISVGSTITATQTIYVYVETSTVPNCSDENSFTVTINSTPTADSPVDVTACDSYVLPLLSVGDYFSSPNGVGPISVGSSINTTQTIYVYAETGTVPNCTDENSFTVTINSTPVADSPTDVTACDSYVLPSLGVGDYFSSPGGVGPISVGSTITATQTIYVYADSGTVPNCADENSFTIDIATFNTGTDVQLACDSYVWIDGNTYTASNNTAQWTLTNIAGCDSLVTLDLTINPSLSGPSIDNSSIVIIPETCASENGSITGIVASGGQLPHVYDWNGVSSSSADTLGLAGGSYTLTVTDDNGCFSTFGPIVVGSISGPSIDPTLISIINEDCNAGNGSITGITIIGGTGPYSYAWNGVAGNLDATNLSNNDYSLVVTDDNGCTDSYGPISISNSGAPNADFDLSGNPISVGETLVVTNNSSNGSVSYLWDLGDGTTSTNDDPSITYNAEGAYTICLIAYTATNCPDTACQIVEVIEEVESVIGIPTAFSPNNDTHNDVLYVRGSGIQSFTLVIYNRYGEKVFETNDLSSGWDGTYKGQPENTGVFAYYLEYEYVNGDKNSLKGNITLVK